MAKGRLSISDLRNKRRKEKTFYEAGEVGTGVEMLRRKG